MEVKEGGLTVIFDVPDSPFELAVIVALPGVTPTTKPVLLTVAMLGEPELQVAVFVIVCDPPVLTVHVAASCCVWPTPMLPVVGLTATPEQFAVSVKKSPQPISNAPAITSERIAISDRRLMIPQKSGYPQDT